MLGSLYFMNAQACFIDGRTLSIVEDIEGARAILTVRPTGQITPSVSGYQVLRLVKSDGVTGVGEHIEVPVVPRGLLLRADRLLLFHHASGYWDVRPAGMLEKFVDAVLQLPPAGEDNPDGWRRRLEFFLPYLDFMDITIAEGAEQEFSKAPYRAIVALKPLIDRERVLKRLEKTSYTAQRLQTTLTLLAVSGDADDAALIEPMIDTLWRQHKTDSLATLLATYLELKGVDGLTLIEQRYLRDRHRSIAELRSMLRALRFHLNETGTQIPADAALTSMRIMLERPRLLPLVLPDLIEQQDWQGLPQIVQAFREHARQSLWLRQAVLDYLRACPLQEAKAALQEFADRWPIGPDSAYLQTLPPERL
jgi:hypothetical protein